MTIAKMKERKKKKIQQKNWEATKKFRCDVKSDRWNDVKESVLFHIFRLRQRRSSKSNMQIWVFFLFCVNDKSRLVTKFSTNNIVDET